MKNQKPKYSIGDLIFIFNSRILLYFLFIDQQITIDPL